MGEDPHWMTAFSPPSALLATGGATRLFIAVEVVIIVGAGEATVSGGVIVGGAVVRVR
jgi:hypothetical protein